MIWVCDNLLGAPPFIAYNCMEIKGNVSFPGHEIFILPKHNAHSYLLNHMFFFCLYQLGRDAVMHSLWAIDSFLRLLSMFIFGTAICSKWCIIFKPLWRKHFGNSHPACTLINNIIKTGCYNLSLCIKAYISSSVHQAFNEEDFLKLILSCEHPEGKAFFFLFKVFPLFIP